MYTVRGGIVLRTETTQNRPTKDTAQAATTANHTVRLCSRMRSRMSFIAVPISGGSLQVRPPLLAKTTPLLRLSIGLLATGGAYFPGVGATCSRAFFAASCASCISLYAA